MTLDELDTEWRAANEAAATGEQRARLIAATRYDVKQLWEQISRRDVRETIAAVFVILYFARYVFVANYVVSMSAVWLVWWGLKVIYKMHRTRTIQKPAAFDAPVREFCRIELDRLDRQIQLLRSVLWWYIGPCLIGVNTFYVGLAGPGIGSLVYCIVTLLLGWGIYRANMRTVTQELTPRRDELTGLLSQLEDGAVDPASVSRPMNLEESGSDTGVAARSVLRLDVSSGVNAGPAAAVRSSLFAARLAALVSLIIGLLSAFGMFIAVAVGAADSGSLAGYLLYCAGTSLLIWSICRAKPVSAELAGKDAAVAILVFILLIVVIVLLNTVTMVALTFGAFDSGYFLYCVGTLLLAWGVFKARSISSFSALALLGALAFLLLAGKGDQPGSGEARRSEGPAGAVLAELVTELRKEHKLIGLAAQVMVDGKVVASAAYGERKKDSKVSIELGDRWHLGSITKSITATMIARLVESGQMKWTDTVGERFPDAAIHADWKPVTLQQLLTHTAGAPANFSMGVRLKVPALGPECTEERRKAVLEVLAEKPVHPPGTKHAYSNVGYTIVGALAERVTGVSWENLVKREVFEPLKLTEAGFGPPKSPSETLPQPRGHRTMLGWKTSVMDNEDNTPIIGPAGTVHMTLGNLSTYAMEHLRGELGTGKLLATETFQHLHKPVLHNYACGWVVRQPTSDIPHTVYWHNGSNTMWYALVVFIPTKNMVVAVASNDGDIKQAESAAWKIVNACANQFNVEGDDARRKALPTGQVLPGK